MRSNPAILGDSRSKFYRSNNCTLVPHTTWSLKPSSWNNESLCFQIILIYIPGQNILANPKKRNFALIFNTFLSSVKVKLETYVRWNGPKSIFLVITSYWYIAVGSNDNFCHYSWCSQWNCSNRMKTWSPIILTNKIALEIQWFLNKTTFLVCGEAFEKTWDQHFSVPKIDVIFSDFSALILLILFSKNVI